MDLKKLMCAAAASVLLVSANTSAVAATIDLGFAIDDSGSVSPSDFNLATQGLANALNQIPIPDPTDPDAITYRISVVAFSSTFNTRTEVDVTEIDSLATLNSVISQVQGISRVGGSTAIGTAIQLLTQNFLDVGLGDSTILNVTTDGGNNSGISTLAGAQFAMANGVDSLGFEAVGFGANTAALAAAAFPGTPVIIDDANDLPDDILSTSFVFEVDSFQDYEAAINAKIVQIVDSTGGGGGGPSPSPVPLPAGMPLLLAGLGGLGYLRSRKSQAA